MNKLNVFVAIAVITGTIIAAIALIPAFGVWLSPREPLPNLIATNDPTSVSGQPAPLVATESSDQKVFSEDDLSQATDIPIPQTASNDCSKMIEGEHHPPILGVDWKFEACNR